MRRPLLYRCVYAMFLGLIASSAMAAQLAGYVPPPRDRVIWVNREFKIESKGMFDSRALTLNICPPSPCTVDIEVTVDPTPAGHEGQSPPFDSTGRTCAFETTPVILVLRNPNAVVTFNLTETGSTHHAKFKDDATGKHDGIYLPTNGGHFTNRVAQAQAFKWKRNEMTGPGQMFGYGYDINVVHDLGAGLCDVPDPVIINRD